MPKASQLNRQTKDALRAAVGIDWVDVKQFGAIGDGLADDTAAIVAAHSASDHVHYPAGRYKVAMANNAALVTISGKGGIRISGQSATIYDPRTYTGDPLAPVFDFVACSDIEVVGVNYEGANLASPATELGVVGGTFIRFRNGSSGLRVEAEIVNARYGVLSGDYSDFSQNNNSDIRARLRTNFCGYPVAIYGADDVIADIYCENVHRAAYLAGVSGGRVDVRWKNQYIADTVVLLTDALVGASTLKGCSDLRVESHDVGSTVFQDSSACCGLFNSRQTSEIIHENLSFNFSVKSSDTVSTKVGGFKLASGPLPGGEPFCWEPTTHLRNIKVSGVIDRSGQTLDSNSAGDIYWNSIDNGPHTATVSNISFENITIIPSSGTTRDCYFEASGLQDSVTFKNVVSSGAVGLRLATAIGTKAVFNNCKLPHLVQSGTVGTIEFNNSIVTSMPSALTASGNPINGSSLNGAGMTLRMKETVLTLSGASVTWTNAIPLGAVVMGCVSIIQSGIAGATGYLLGIGTDTARWANVNNTSPGLATTPNNYGAAGLVPQIYTATTNIVVTAKTSNFTGGSLKIVLFYFDTTCPTK